MVRLLDGTEAGPPWARLLTGLFQDIYPPSIVDRIVDVFLSEGYKTIVRFALAHVLLRQDDIKAARTWNALGEAIVRPVDPEDAVPFRRRLFRTAFHGLHFSRQIIHHSRTKHRKLSVEDFDDQDRALILQQAVHAPHLVCQSAIVTEGAVWETIWAWLPGRFRVLRADLIFATREHGHHLSTLFLRAGLREPLLLIVETVCGQRVGAYLSRSFVRRWKERIYGTGETFLFALPPVGSSVGGEMYAWTGNNDAFIMANEGYVAIGCSESAFGLWIDRDLERVSSQACATFGNPGLFEGGGEGVVKALELWTFIA